MTARKVVSPNDCYILSVTRAGFFVVRKNGKRPRVVARRGRGAVPPRAGIRMSLGSHCIVRVLALALRSCPARAVGWSPLIAP